LSSASEEHRDGEAYTCRSVEVPLPVVGDEAGRTRDGLVERVMIRSDEGRSVIELVGGVTPEPVLAGLEAADDRVPGRLGVGGGVLGR
jgi:hypothetical protein